MIKINTIMYLFLFFLEEIMISKVNFCDSSKIFSQSYRQYLLEIESLLYLKKKELINEEQCDRLKKQLKKLHNGK